MMTHIQAADVPIVKLNPLNILTVKAEGEKELREVSQSIPGTSCVRFEFTLWETSLVLPGGQHKL